MSNLGPFNYFYPRTLDPLCLISDRPAQIHQIMEEKHKADVVRKKGCRRKLNNQQAVEVGEM